MRHIARHVIYIADNLWIGTPWVDSSWQAHEHDLRAGAGRPLPGDVPARGGDERRRDTGVRGPGHHPTVPRAV